MDGSGLWERLNKTKIKLPITKKQVEGVKHAFTKGLRDNWPPQSRTLFAKYGDRKVLPSSFVACRYPISTNEMVKNIANLLGRKVPHDDLFHLQILFSVEGAPELAIDKNEDMRLRTAKHKRARPEMECIPLQYNGPSMTLNEMVDNTMKLMGKEKFFSYSSFLNNCQDFVLNFMKANQLSGDMAWIKQDIADLLPKWAKKLADVGTNFKNIQKLVVEGKGNKSGGGIRREQAIIRAKELLDIYERAEFSTENENMLRRISSILTDLFRGNRQVKEDAIERLAEIDTYRIKSANKIDPYNAPSRGDIDGDGILENYLKLNPFNEIRGSGLFDELEKMRTPEGQDRSYCSRSFANVRFVSKEGKTKAMNSCMAKRKKERGDKQGNGILKNYRKLNSLMIL